MADDVLGMTAEALEKRDQEGKARAAAGEEGKARAAAGEEGGGEQPGMRDVLRGLSRVIDR